MKSQIKKEVLSFLMPRIKEWIEKEESVGLKLRIHQAIDLTIQLTANQIFEDLEKIRQENFPAMIIGREDLEKLKSKWVKEK